ncbi:serine/threonine protein kinase [Friedmanniella luteola]|uniref:non-specific serine/threonine protein kinase n=1 Tax=Friedmanniella luteola TaxID=546871 RepID=A0A1H1L1W8_9ACTN|nr:Stk1 family PASTA domain-containing Ser/Thr kinase [Friedmanniella luteola]SDR68025.1 serine/threonine protein kinase [Friedmanniella luteola]SDT44082.1 serine/threonine protein kinase [Friedmanniella luteola]
MTGEPITVGGRYELGDVLGRGGMAEVRGAVDRRLGRPVAVKQLRADLATDPTFQARFRREAQSAAGLNHPTIVAVYDTGEEPDPHTGISIPYIVMELVEGSTLRDVLRDGRKILPERALELVQGVLDALSYSHKAGIIHRDIKPANVMLTPTGGVKVMDFGIARAVADTSATMTQTAAVIGTAQYLSPEQARGETVDARSDIYSAGCLLYELLVGRPPFIGESPVSVAYQHVREAPVPPSQLDPVITPDIDAITLKALAKDPADRYQSAREMKADITRVLAGQQATAVVPRVGAVPADAAPTQLVPVPVAPPLDEDEEEPPRRRAGVVAAVVALVLLLIGAGAFGLWRAFGPQDPEPVAMVEVPAVITYPQALAEARLTEVGLKAEVRRTNGADGATKGTITAQNPIGGTQVPTGSTVGLTLNVGPKTAKIPGDLVGTDVDDAEKALADAGFTNVSTEAATSEDADAEENEVLAVDPGEGDTAALDDEIVLSYATGESAVPVLTGKTPEQALSDARTAGFTNVKRVDQETDDETAGVVFKQNPDAGEREKRSKQITITVAVAPPPPEPDPTTPPPTPEASESPAPTPGSTPGETSPTPGSTPG